ncbi:MAG: hypothetical protein ABL903_06320 [Methylococcales bacterium]
MNCPAVFYLQNGCINHLQLGSVDFLPKSNRIEGIAGVQAGMSRSLPSLALDTRFLAGMTQFLASIANKVP